MSDDWEDVLKGSLRRLKVPGGWLYEAWHFRPDFNEWVPTAPVFVPDETDNDT